MCKVLHPDIYIYLGNKEDDESLFPMGKFTPEASSRHFVSDKKGKLRGTRHKGRNSAVKSSQLSWKVCRVQKCVQ